MKNGHIYQYKVTDNEQLPGRSKNELTSQFLISKSAKNVELSAAELNELKTLGYSGYE